VTRIDMNIAMLARACRTTPYLIKAALPYIRPPAQERTAIDWWNELPEHVRNAVIDADKPRIWARFDQITTPDVSPAPQRLRVI
jgi:hypothetical protein